MKVAEQPIGTAERGVANARRNTSSAGPILNVVVADDHPLIRSGIKTALLRVNDLVIVGEAATGDEALEAVIRHQPDLLILDISMPGLRTDEVVTRSRLQVPTLKVLILSAYDDDVYIRRLSRVAINGYQLKDEAPEGLAQAVRVIEQGAYWFSGSVAARLMAMHRETAGQPSSIFSPREQEVLALLLRGVDNAGIGKELSLATQTVRNCNSTIYQKMGVENRVQALVWARERAQ